jgi:hypothetical protein
MNLYLTQRFFFKDRETGNLHVQTFFNVQDPIWYMQDYLPCVMPPYNGATHLPAKQMIGIFKPDGTCNATFYNISGSEKECFIIEKKHNFKGDTKEILKRELPEVVFAWVYVEILKLLKK